MERYSRNMSALSERENQSLRHFRFCIVGCGGLGQYIAEMLGRLGIGNLTLVDGDVFAPSNLNRQIYSDMDNMGVSKVECAYKRMQKINPLVEIKTLNVHLDQDNAVKILEGHHAAVDALDNRESRRILQDATEKSGIPLVHGAIAGWYGQVTTIFPGDRTFDLLYGNSQSHGIEQELGNPPFAPALVASIQVSEVVKILIKRGELLRKRVLMIDLLNQEYDVVSLLV